MASNVAFGSMVQTGSVQDRAAVYTAHLRDTLLPQLEISRQGLMVVEHDISEYEILRGKLNELQASDSSIETLTELGAGVWVEARVNPKMVTLDLGFDLHLDMVPSEAKEYTNKKLEILKMKRDTLSQKEEHLVWQIGQFQGAMNSVDA
ncbi:hypothetical protein IAU60_006403 [Kwoniella sp. DSM 27419]